MLDYCVPINVGGTTVASGDLLFADDEGVLVIPREVEAEAVERAPEKNATESRVAEAIHTGMSTVDAFRTFGVM